MSEQDSLSAMRRAAMNLLARRDYSRHELATRLQRRFGEQAGVESVLDWLQGQNFLNEERFAEAFVRSRIERGQGELRIRQELSARGLADELIDRVLAAAECDWFELARQTHRRRFHHGPGGDMKEKARQLRFLQYRGFSGEQCFQALDSAPAPPEKS